jgi:hypothetical protein
MRLTRVSWLAALLAVGVLAAPPIAQAKPGPKNGNGTSKSCEKKPAVSKAFVVKGTLNGLTGSQVIITVTGANRHAQASGELADQDVVLLGVQYLVEGTLDPFELKLSGYAEGEDPAVGDKVRIKGKIALTKAKCAEEGATLDERYVEPNVKRVKIIDD